MFGFVCTQARAYVMMFYIGKPSKTSLLTALMDRDSWRFEYHLASGSPSQHKILRVHFQSRSLKLQIRPEVPINKISDLRLGECTTYQTSNYYKSYTTNVQLCTGCPCINLFMVFVRNWVSANNARTRFTSSLISKSTRAPSSNRYEISAMEASCGDAS